MITQTIDLSMTPEVQILPEVFCSQYDNGIRQVVFNLYTDDTLTTPYSVDGLSAIVQGTKPDGNAYAQDATASGSSVTVMIGTQMAAVAGITPSEIVLTDGTVRVGSLNFLLMVEQAGILDTAVVSDSEIPAYVNSAAASAAAAAASEAAAKASETNAAGSENAAAARAAAAAASEAAAKTSETNAAGSEDAAKASETNAAASETNAAESEAAAAESDSNAEAWAVGTRDGQPVPDTDPAYQNNSKWWSNVSGGRALVALTDVDVPTPPTDNALLQYDAESDKWKEMDTPLKISMGGTGNNKGYIQAGSGGATTGSNATAEGYNTVSTGPASHAEGSNTKAMGQAAHAEGLYTNAVGQAAHAEGVYTRAAGYASHAGGRGIDLTTSIDARRDVESIFGKANGSEKAAGLPIAWTSGAVFGVDCTAESFAEDTEVQLATPRDTTGARAGSCRGGLNGVIKNTAKVTITLEPMAIYILLCNAFTISNGALYGAAARMISPIPVETGTPNSINLAGTQTVPATIAVAANNVLTIQNTAATRVTQFTLIRVM